MLKLLVQLSIIVCIVALPHQVREKRAEKSDQISYPKEDDEKAAAPVEEKAPTGNGTEVDSRFLGVGIGLGLAVGNKLLGGGHHQGYGGLKSFSELIGDFL